MISKVEKKRLLFKAMIIILISLVIIVILRALFLHTDLLESDFVYVHMFKEFSLSVLTSIFIVIMLYVLMKKELLGINNKALSLAFTDGLTGLYNRHYLNDFLEKFSSMRKEDSSFAILFIDIDRFKEVNDTLGHNTGDCILKCLAAHFRSLVRPKDILCRYGGEEFVFILTDISNNDALQKAQQIRTAVQDMHFKCKQESITVSVGISFGSRDDDINTIVEESDSALYMAKDAGRNCVKVFAE